MHRLKPLLIILVGLCVLEGCSTEPSEYRKNLLNSEYNDAPKKSTPSSNHYCLKNTNDSGVAGALLAYAMLAGAVLTNSRNGTAGPEFQQTSDAQKNSGCNSASQTGINSH